MSISRTKGQKPGTSDCYTNIHSPTSKDRDRERIQHDINMYLTHGKTIEAVPLGVSGERQLRLQSTTKGNGNLSSRNGYVDTPETEITVTKK